MQKENIVVKEVPFITSPLAGKGGTRYRVRGCKRAFTLIELLVVVLIVGILTAVAVPQYQLAVDKSKYTSLMPVIRAIKNAQEIYFLENGEYATSINELNITVPQTVRYAFLPDSVAGYIYHNNILQNTLTISYDHSGFSGAERMACFAYTGPRSERLCKSIAGKNLYNSCDNTCKAARF